MREAIRRSASRWGVVGIVGICACEDVSRSGDAKKAGRITTLVIRPAPLHHVQRDYARRALIRSTKSTGRWATPMPAARNDSIFSAAVPSEPEMIAPAWPIRRPGGAV